MSGLIDKYETLLTVSQAIALNRDMPSLLNALAEHLHTVVHFEFFDILLYDPLQEQMTFLFSGISGKRDDRFVLEDGPGGWVWTNQKPYVCSIKELLSRFPKAGGLIWGRKDMQSICVVPLTSAQRRLGTLEFLSPRPSAYDEEDTSFIQQVASQVAVAVDNALNYETATISREKLRSERDHLSILLRVTNAVSSKRDVEELVKNVSQAISEVFRVEHICFLIHVPELNRFRAYTLTDPDLIDSTETSPIEQSPWTKAFNERQRYLVPKGEIEYLASSDKGVAAMIEQNNEFFCYSPLVVHRRCVGVLAIAHKEKDMFSAENLEILDGISDQLAIGIENALGYQEITQLKDRLASEKLYLEAVINFVRLF